MSEQTNQTIPEIELQSSQLPSRGVPYPKNAWIKYKTYTWGEVRRASTSNSSVADSLREVLKGITCSFDKNNLTVADALYLGTARKISTFSGMQIEVPYVCRYCGTTNKGTFNHSDIHFRDLGDEITEFPLCADIQEREIEFAPMTVKEYLAIHDGRWDRVLGDNKIDEIAVQATWVKNLDYPEAYELISGLNDPEDFEVITEIDKMIRHDMKPIDMKCENKKCGETNSIRLEGRDALLRPFRGGEKPKRNRVRIGKRTQSTDDNS